MSNKIVIKDSFDIDAKFSAFFTGGKIEWSLKGDEILCQDANKINIYNTDEGKVTFVIAEPKLQEDDIAEDPIYTFDLSPDNLLVVTSHKSGLIKLWNKIDSSLLKMWKGVHNGPIQKLKFNSKSNLIASGGSDGTIRIWNYEHKTCIASLRGCVGIISVIIFYPDPDIKIVVGVSDDNKILGWNFDKRDIIFTLNGHFSRVTSLSFTNDNEFLVSGSRDKVIILWDYKKQTTIKTIPLYEAVESCIVLKDNTKLPNGYTCEKGMICVATGGEEGIVKIWEMTQGKLIYTQTNSIIEKSSDEIGLTITQMLCNEQNTGLAIVSADHNILLYNLETFECSKQIIGYHDEILDLAFLGKNEQFLAVATNSNHIKLYDISNMSCKILKGHTDIVLSLSKHKNLLLSSSKDNSIRLWEIDFKNFDAKCVGIGAKHTASVGSVAFGNVSSKMCASVSQDTCLKLWSLPKKFANDEITTLTCTETKIAHEKDINCVTISPNDKLLATGSQDKSAKLWSAQDLSLVGVLRGHRRGVWCVRFSPIDQILLTTSADCTVKLWSLSDLNCIKTFEGHEGSVIRGEFFSSGTQILSASADGIIKVWSVKTSDCCTTMEHDCKIWAIAITNDDKYFYSGGSDSQLIKWKDTTEEKKLKAFEEHQELVLQEQELNNLLKEKKILKALKYALRLERPLLTLKIITDVIKSQDENGLQETIKKLNENHKESLLKHATSWNTNSRNCRSAQLVLNILLKEILKNDLHPNGLQKVVEETLPYTERHFNRVTEYMKDLKFLEYTMKCIQPTFDFNKILE